MNTKIVFNRTKIDVDKLGTNNSVKINRVINKRIYEGLLEISEQMKYDISVQVEFNIRDSFNCYDSYTKKDKLNYALAVYSDLLKELTITDTLLKFICFYGIEYIKEQLSKDEKDIWSSNC